VEGRVGGAGAGLFGRLPFFVGPLGRLLADVWGKLFQRQMDSFEPGNIFAMTHKMIFCNSSMATFSSLVRPTLIISINRAATDARGIVFAFFLALSRDWLHRHTAKFYVDLIFAD